jgi:hypothetical protein
MLVTHNRRDDTQHGTGHRYVACSSSADGHHFASGGGRASPDRKKPQSREARVTTLGLIE